MIYFNNNIVCFTLFCCLFFVRCLEILSADENDDIALTEAVIRETTNNLFATFRIRDLGHKPRLKDFSIIHNFFVSITLKDCNNLKRISRLIQVHNLDNNTQHFIAQINEVLNEGDKSLEATEDVNVNILIEKIINKLRDFKKTYTFNRNFGNYSINSKVLEHLNGPGVTFGNISNNLVKANKSDDNALKSEEIWKPTEKSGRRIFAGHRTRIKHYPFMASIHFFERFQCGGSIIQKDLVITAASCLQLAWNNRFFRENPSFLSVQVGSDYYEAGGEDIPVYEVYFHPDYTPKTLHNNLVLLRLITHIVFSKKHRKVRRVQFDTSPFPLPSNANGIIIVGWGAKDRSNIVYDPWVNKLSFSELEYYPLKDCQEVYSKEFVTTKHFCAGFFSKASGACQNDVGGPGLSGGILVGVISFGPPTCGTPDAPTVFTKVGFYKDWINQIINMPVPDIDRLSTLRQPKTTIGVHYSDRTTKGFILGPIEHVANKYTKAPYEVEMNLPKDTLRILEDDQLFKDFLSTMFGNESKDDVGLSENVVSDLTKARTKKDIKRKSKSISTTYSSTAHPTLSDIEEDTRDFIVVNTKKVVGRYFNTKLTTSTSAILPTYDIEDSGLDLSEVQTKKKLGRRPNTKYDARNYTEAYLKKVKGRKSKKISTPSTSTQLGTLYDEYLYSDEDTTEYDNKMEASEYIYRIYSTKAVKGKINMPDPKLKTHTTSTTSFIQYPDKDIKDLDIEELIKKLKVTETNPESKITHTNELELDSNNDDSKLDMAITQQKEEYVYEDDEKYLPKMKARETNTNTVYNAMNKNEDSALEKDINDLLDDLDLRKLLESEEPTSAVTKKRKQKRHKKINQSNISRKEKDKKSKRKTTQIASYSSDKNKKEDSGESDFDS